MLKISGTGSVAQAFVARIARRGPVMAIAVFAGMFASGMAASAQEQLPWKAPSSDAAYQGTYNGNARVPAATYDNGYRADDQGYRADNRQAQSDGGYYPQPSGDAYNPTPSNVPTIRQPSRDPYAQPPATRGGYGNQGSREYGNQGNGGYAPQPRRTYNNSPNNRNDRGYTTPQYNSSRPYRQSPPTYQEPAYQEPAYQPPYKNPQAGYGQQYPDNRAGQNYERAPDGSYTMDEITRAGHGFFGSVSKGLASVIEHAFKRSGRPNGYILGEGAGGAFIAGLRYGEGRLYTKHAGTHRVYWQGPSVGYDAGAEGSKTMILVYNLRDPSEIYQRFGGVAGSAYLVGGVGITLQKRGRIVLAPIRAGVGLRLGANVGYLKYTRRPTWNPF